MLSFLNMECQSCGSVYMLSVEDPNVIATFRCFECEQYSVYFAGRVLKLSKTIMENAADKTKRRHVMETLQEYAETLSRDLLGSTGKIVNVNTPVDLASGGDTNKTTIKLGKVDRASRVRRQPSIRRADAPRISPQEVSDFVRIDLNLIDDSKHFDEFFGQNCN